MSVPPVAPRRDEARVSLVFPPLVPSSESHYYPSTAVLAGFLSARGVPASQGNLNGAFVKELLDPAQLERIGAGTLPDGLSVDVTNITSIAARLLRRARAASPAAAPRPVSGSRDEPTRLADLIVSDLLESFVIDDRVDVLCTPEFFSGPTATRLREFYARIRFVEGLGPAIHTVGISVAMGSQLGPALILAEQVKASRSDVVVILGGPILSLMANVDLERLLKFVPAVDAVVRYEGEIPLGKLVEQREKGEWDPFVVPGVSVLKGARLHETPPVTGIRLEELSYPEYDADILAGVPESPISIIQARGCYWGRCTYCDYVELYDGSPKYRTRLPESFVDEMEYQIAKHGRRNFRIVTEAIPAPFARKMSETIIARGLDVTWSSFAMVDPRFTVEVLETLVRGGCERLVIGMETLNTRVLKLVEKAADREQNIEFLRNAKRAGIKLIVNLIVDLPTTTYAEALENLQVLESIRDCFQQVRVWRFEATKSSAIGRSPGKFGLRVVDEGDGRSSARRSNLLSYVDPAMTEEERNDVHQRYSAFAISIDSTALMAAVEGGDGAHGRSRWFRLADEHLDFVDTDSGLHCFNWVTRKSFAAESGIEKWRGLFDLLREKPQFDRSWFERQFESTAVAKGIFDMLVAEHFIRPCDAAAPSARRSSPRSSAKGARAGTTVGT